jgi:hypothetical protein
VELGHLVEAEDLVVVVVDPFGAIDRAPLQGGRLSPPASKTLGIPSLLYTSATAA